MASTTLCTCKNKRHGSSRSLVRRIGSRLPISTGKRIYIRVPGMDSPAGINLEANEFRYDSATGQRYTPNEQGLTLASCINNPRQLLAKAVDIFQLDPAEEEGEGLMETGSLGEGGVVSGEEEEEMVISGESGTQQEAIDKISALEGELARLKAQIAIYALAEEEEEEVMEDTDSAVPVPPPPPPIAPPPPATPAHQTLHSSNVTSTPSATSNPSFPPGAPLLQTPGPQETPGPLDVGNMLRDIGSVKLRTVNMARSPGGTPLRPTNKGARLSDPNDPAAIIAQALRRKFSHRVFKNSPDKENLDRSDASNFGADSPTVKLLK